MLRKRFFKPFYAVWGVLYFFFWRILAGFRLEVPRQYGGVCLIKGLQRDTVTPDSISLQNNCN